MLKLLAVKMFLQDSFLQLDGNTCHLFDRERTYYKLCNEYGLRFFHPIVLGRAPCSSYQAASKMTRQRARSRNGTDDEKT